MYIIRKYERIKLALMFRDIITITTEALMTFLIAGILWLNRK